MSYELEFTEKALKKFDKLNPQIADQFIHKLESILVDPKIPKNKLRGSPDLYKIKRLCCTNLSVKGFSAI